MYLDTFNSTNLLYFFSTLAQCAAAFAGLAGVFAIFRLQANASKIGEVYISARFWLRTSGERNNADSLPTQEVKRLLNEIKEGGKDESQRKSAEQVLEGIFSVEAFNQKLVLKVSKPLRLWAYIFIFSLALIPSVKWYEGSSGAFVVVAFLSVSVVALYTTGRFVQRCLDFK